MDKKKKTLITLIITLLVTIAAIGSAISAENIIEAHEESLKLYRCGKVKEAVKVLEESGIQDIMENIPRDMTREDYALILNDYAFYLSETEDRYEEAVPLLERVIEIEPERAAAYLNIADTYLKIYQEGNDESLKEKARDNYNKYLSLLDKDAGIPYRVREFLLAEAFEKSMEEIRKSEYEINNNFLVEELSDDFFKEFILDFKDGKNIEFIEPVLVTDDINDRELREYFGNDTEFIEELITEAIEGGFSPTIEYRAEYDYKLYHLDFDNNPENGEEYIFYAGGYMDIWGGELQSSWDNYLMIDLDNNSIVAAVGVAKTIDYIDKKPADNFNGIIRYKDRYFIYEIKETNYSIVLHTWNNEHEYIAAVVSFYLEREEDNK